MAVESHDKKAGRPLENGRGRQGAVTRLSA